MPDKYIKDAVKSSYFVLAMSLFAIIAGYLLRMYLSKTLTINDFGLFYAISAFMGIFGLIRYLGLDQALARFIPAFLHRKETGKIKGIILIVTAVHILMALILTGFLFVFRDAIALSLFKTGTASTIITITALCFLPSVFFILFQAVFRGFQRMKSYALVEPVRIATTFVFAVLFIPMGVEGVALAYLAAAIITSAIFAASFFKLDVLEGKAYVSGAFAKNIFIYSAPIFVTGIATVIINSMDTILLTAFRSLSEVALYQVAMPTSQLLMVFANSIAAVAMPMISGLYAAKRKDDVAKSVKVMTIFVLILIVPFVILMFSFSDIVLLMLFGESFTAAAPALGILALSMILYSIFVVFQSAFDGVGKPFINTKTVYIIAGINLAANIILVPFYGITGAAIAFFIAFAIGVLYSYKKLEEHIGIDLGSSIAKISALIASSLITVVAVWLLRKTAMLPFYEELTLLVLLSMAIYFTLIIVTRAVTIEDVNFLESKNVRIPKAMKRIIRFLARR